MKPLSRQSSNQPFRRHDDRTRHNVRNFPQTDYRYQASADAVAASRQQNRARVRLSDLRDFRKISSDFMAAETRRDYVAEATLFALVTGIAAWPIISLLIVLAQTARG